MNKDDEFYMSLAIEEAENAARLGEVPVGAVIVWDDGRIVGRGFNKRETGKNALLHAELSAINEACSTLRGWRLHRATLYVTLEPCPMCAGAVINSRIKRVVYGAADPKAGALGSVMQICGFGLNHNFEQVGGVMNERCSGLISDFFADLRKKREDKKSKNSGNEGIFLPTAVDNDRK